MKNPPTNDARGDAARHPKSVALPSRGERTGGLGARGLARAYARGRRRVRELIAEMRKANAKNT